MCGRQTTIWLEDRKVPLLSPVGEKRCLNKIVISPWTSLCRALDSQRHCCSYCANYLSIVATVGLLFRMGGAGWETIKPSKFPITKKCKTKQFSNDATNFQVKCVLGATFFRALQKVCPAILIHPHSGRVPTATLVESSTSRVKRRCGRRCYVLERLLFMKWCQTFTASRQSRFWAYLQMYRVGQKRKKKKKTCTNSK